MFGIGKPKKLPYFAVYTLAEKDWKLLSEDLLLQLSRKILEKGCGFVGTASKSGANVFFS